MQDKPGQPASIPLYVIGGVATVWDAQIAATLHCEHDVAGLRVGTLPGVVQQNAFLGLPITLTPEEATHLVKKGVAHLVDVPPTLRPPSPSLVAERTAARVAHCKAVAAKQWADEDRKAAESAANSAAGSAAATAKRAARARKRAETTRAAALAAGEEPPEVIEARFEKAIAAIGDAPPPKPYTPPVRDEPTAENTNIFTVVPAMPVLDVLVPRAGEVDVEGEECEEELPWNWTGDRDATSAVGRVAHFPRSVRDRALAETFSALHARGYRMGLGPRFGGEWLVYPGDYLRYHAHFTSQVIVRDEPIRPAELVAWGRLGTGTKKAGLLCCWDDGGGRSDAAQDPAGGEVTFYSLEWANFG